MAYSDYGGYAFKNGKRVVDRSDFTIMPDGSGVGTPGAYPGFAAIEAGVAPSEVKTFASYPHYHAVLGDAPILIGLHKQSSISLHRGTEQLTPADFMETKEPEAISTYESDGKSRRYINTDFFIDKRPCVLNVDGVRIEIVWEVDDNHYQYVRVQQPDGNVWCGWSGYGVGAGLEDCGYGFSTEDRNARLCAIWPDAIAA